jgi:hypothetical protein
MIDNLFEIPKTPEKEVFTVKHNGGYYAAITGEQSIFMSLEVFDSPLKASNHARALKRQHNIDVKIKKDKKINVVNNTTKIARKKQLYTEAEMASETKLKFREVWVILSPQGEYAVNVLEKDTVVNYVPDRQKAQAYKTYEEAVITLNVLDKVIRKGHQLRRFFERVDS